MLYLDRSEVVYISTKPVVDLEDDDDTLSDSNNLSEAVSRSCCLLGYSWRNVAYSG